MNRLVAVAPQWSPSPHRWGLLVSGQGLIFPPILNTHAHTDVTSELQNAIDSARDAVGSATTSIRAVSSITLTIQFFHGMSSCVIGVLRTFDD